jgi:SAM-dependent methyltransferase
MPGRDGHGTVETKDAVTSLRRRLRDRDRAEQLWHVNVDATPPRRPGARGYLVAPAKTLLRPLVRWYVRPLVDAQRDFNDVALKLIDDLHGQLLAAIDERRVEELEERVLRLERVPRAPALPAPPPAQVAEPSPPLDYFAFEARMRGSRSDIRARQHVYLADFKGQAPVLDVGCGRGEFLSLLREAGIDAYGVDGDADMVAFCRSEGLPVEHAEALAYVAGLAAGSLGGIFAAQFVEHLPPAALVRFLELAAAKIHSGGTLVLETLNPLSLGTLKNFFADLTHAQPLVPETLVLLVRQAGFARTEVRFLNEPPEEERLRAVELPRDRAFDEARVALAANVARLNEILFGPQDYAVVARR